MERLKQITLPRRIMVWNKCTERHMVLFSVLVNLKEHEVWLTHTSRRKSRKVIYRFLSKLSGVWSR